MAESMKGLKRSHRCTEVTKADIGSNVTLMGWVQKSRNKGGIVFVDLRDRSGIMQVIFENSDIDQEGFEKAGKLRSEFVIAVTGRVEARSGAVNQNLATGEIDESVFYAGSHGDWIADLAIALKNDTKARFLVITENRGAIPNMPYDAMVEVPAYIGKKGPEVIAQNEIPLFQQGLMMQQLNSEKLLVEGCIEGSYEKVLQAFTLNKTVPSMKVAKEILDDMIEANKEYWPELK